MPHPSFVKRLIALALCLCMLLCLSGCSSANQYDRAIRLLAQGKYDKAAKAFEALGNYLDSSKLTLYAKAAAAGEAGDYDLCIRAFETLGDFEDSPTMIAYYEARSYEAEADAALAEAKKQPLEEVVFSFEWRYYLAAADMYDRLPLFRDSHDRAENCRKVVYQLGEDCADKGYFGGAFVVYSALGSYNDSALLTDYYDARNFESTAEDTDAPSPDGVAMEFTRAKYYAKAAAIYDNLPLFRDSDKRVDACRKAAYELSGQLAQMGLYQEASEVYAALGNYNDSANLSAYYAACQLEVDGQYEQAAMAFEGLGTFSDAAARAGAARQTGYDKGVALLAEGEYESAYAILGELGTYNGADQRIMEGYYQQAEEALAAGEYDEAYRLFETLGGYAPVNQADKLPGVVRMQEVKYLQGLSLMTAAEPDYSSAREAFEQAENLQVMYGYTGVYTPVDEGSGTPAPTPAQLVAECWYLEGDAMLTAWEEEVFGNTTNVLDDGVIWQMKYPNYFAYESTAMDCFRNAGAYPGASTRLQRTYYQLAEEMLADGAYEDAARYFSHVGRVNDEYAADNTPFIPEQLAADLEAAGLSDWETRKNEAYYLQGMERLAAKEYGHAMIAFGRAGDYPGANEEEQKLRPMYKGIIAAGQMHVLALKPDGTVLAWGDDWNEGGVNVDGWTDIAAVSADLRKSVGLTTDGTLVESKSTEDDMFLLALLESEGTASDAPSGTGLAVVHAQSDSSIPYDQPHAIGVKLDGTFFGPTELNDSLFASDELSTALLEAQSWTDLVDVSAGFGFITGLRKDGTVVAAGDNENGQCNVQDWKDIVAIDTATQFTVGLKSNGTVLLAGWDSNGKLDVSGWTDIVAVAVSDNHIAGLKANGTVVATGTGRDHQLDVEEWHDIVAIAVNGERTIGLTADGKVLSTKARYEDNPLEDWEGIFPNPDRVKTPEQRREEALLMVDEPAAVDQPAEEDQPQEELSQDLSNGILQSLREKMNGD